MAKASAKKVVKKSAPAKKAAAPAKKSAAAPKKTAKKPVAKKSAATKKKAAKKETKKKPTTSTSSKASSTKKSAVAAAPATKKTKTVPKKSAAPAKKSTAKKSAAAPAAAASGPSNDDIMNTFSLLAAYEQKYGDNKYTAGAYRKAVDAMKKFVAAGNNITSGQSIAHLSGVGHATVSKTDELIKTGKIKKLESLKDDNGELPSALVNSIMKGGSSGTTTAKSSAAAAKSSGSSSTAGASNNKSAGSAKTSKIFDAATMQKIKDEEDILSGKSNDALKNLARLNDQKVSGNKAELVERLGNQVVLGRINRCPSCAGGKLRFDVKTGNYSCPGYRDDEDYIPCFATFSHETSADDLRSPWIAS